jgi:hypothetical protein
MRRSPRSREAPSLSESLHHQLNMYANSATAAGVSLLALAQPSEAKIVYTPIHKVISRSSSYGLALNHETVDFIIRNSYCRVSEFCNSSTWDQLSVAASFGKPGNRVVGSAYAAAALKGGVRINDTKKFNGRSMALKCRGACNASHSSTLTRGPWRNVTNRYLGLKFKINGQTHYAWARLNVEVSKTLFEITAVLTGFAYETIPNKGIVAGQTKGPDDDIVEEPSASLTVPTSRPSRLGVLALGAPGLSIWRREEQVSSRQ